VSGVVPVHYSWDVQRFKALRGAQARSNADTIAAYLMDALASTTIADSTIPPSSSIASSFSIIHHEARDPLPGKPKVDCADGITCGVQKLAATRRGYMYIKPTSMALRTPATAHQQEATPNIIRSRPVAKPVASPRRRNISKQSFVAPSQ